MTRRHDLMQQRQSLDEIREIMNSMKTLAYMETRKLEQFLATQQQVVDSIEEMAADFLTSYPELLPASAVADNVSIYLLIGTERGFCGDFNHALLNQLTTTGQGQWIAVGHKLHTLLAGNNAVTAFIDGASVVEDIPAVLNQLVETLVQLQHRHGALNLQVLYHDSLGDIVMEPLLPPFQQYRDLCGSCTYPPVLNVPPASFVIDLIEHYLFAVLHTVLYSSLMAENHRRVKHLEGAVRHLDDKSAQLLRLGNTLRQEEIIEEIEVILLSAASLAELHPHKK